MTDFLVLILCNQIESPMGDSLGPHKKKRKARPLAHEEGAERRQSIQEEKPPSDNDGAKRKKKALNDAKADENVIEDGKERVEKTVLEQDGTKDKKKRKKKKHLSIEEAPQREDTGTGMEAVVPANTGKHQVGLEGRDEKRRRKKEKEERKQKSIKEGKWIVLNASMPCEDWKCLTRPVATTLILSMH